MLMKKLKRLHETVHTASKHCNCLPIRLHSRFRCRLAYFLSRSSKECSSWLRIEHDETEQDLRQRRDENTGSMSVTREFNTMFNIITAPGLILSKSNKLMSMQR